MKLYRFDFYNHKIQKNILEVEEKPKTYFIKEKYGNTRINKLEVGIVNYNSVYLLEDNIEKAKEIFRSDINQKIEKERRKIVDANKRIEEYENDLNGILSANTSTRKQLEEKLSCFANQKDPCGGIVLHITGMNEIFTVSFGDGTNIENGYDDYLYMTRYVYDKDVAEKIQSKEYEETDWQGKLKDIDGGQLDFRYDETDYDEDITKAVYDALMFSYDKIPSFELLTLYHH